MCVSTAATWVGGGFVNGIVESVYDPTKGLIWALIPLQMSLSFIIGKHWNLTYFHVVCLQQGSQRSLSL